MNSKSNVDGLTHTKQLLNLLCIVYLRNLPTHTVNNLLQKLNYVKRIQYSVVKQKFNIIHIICENYIKKYLEYYAKHSLFKGSAVAQCLTRDRRAGGSSLTGVTALWSLSKTHFS